MTKRTVIVTTSVIVAIMMVFTILFGVVFRVRDIDLVYGDNFEYKTQIAEILASSKLKKNTSIFEVDRDKIASNIEKEYPYARVQVNLSSLTSVKIKLSNRIPLYYFVQNNVYYILDDDCKILQITTTSQDAVNYIQLDRVFNATESNVAGEFLNNRYTNVCKSIYNALYMYVGEDSDNDGVLDKTNITREDICSVIRSVKFNKTNELFGEVDQLIMTTSYGTTISIIEPQKDLNLKTNMALSALRKIIADDNKNGTNLSSLGSINVSYTYDQYNNQNTICYYSAN